MKKMQAPDIEIIVRDVDRLVRNRQNMNRFREMVRRWYNAHTDKPEYELLPLSSRKHTLTEMYTLLAVIHDRYCGGMEQIDPWTKVPKLSLVGTAYFDLFSYVDTQLYDNDNCTLENYLHHVKADLDAKVTIANEGQTTDTDSNISVRVKTTVGKGSKKKKNKKPKKSEKEFQPWKNSGDACFIIENDRIKFHYQEQIKDLKLKKGSHTLDLLVLLSGTSLQPSEIQNKICPDTKNKASKIVNYANELLNKKIAQIGFVDVPTNREFIKRDNFGHYCLSLDIHEQNQFEQLQLQGQLVDDRWQTNNDDESYR